MQDTARRQVTAHALSGTPDEVREFPNGTAEIFSVGGDEIGRLTFRPGFRWSNDLKPIAKTDSCEAPHFQYHLSGRLAIRMDDGTEFVAEPGRHHLAAERPRRLDRRRRACRGRRLVRRERLREGRLRPLETRRRRALGSPPCEP